MSNVIDLDSHRFDPHATFMDATGDVHVVPISAIQDVASGKVSVKDIEAPEYLQAIVQLYLDNVIYPEWPQLRPTGE